MADDYNVFPSEDKTREEGEAKDVLPRLIASTEEEENPYDFDIAVIRSILEQVKADPYVSGLMDHICSRSDPDGEEILPEQVINGFLNISSVADFGGKTLMESLKKALESDIEVWG